MVEIATHDSESAAELRDSVLRVWESSFGPVTDVQEWRSTVWERHRARAGYRLVTALDRNALVGFAWGYTGAAGQYWTDSVREKLGDSLAGWLDGHFEFVELAVTPEVRRLGIGGRLHDALLHGLPHERALLGTSLDPGDPAVRLYRSRGWRSLGSPWAGYQVMGRTLAIE